MTKGGLCTDRITPGVMTGPKYPMDIVSESPLSILRRSLPNCLAGQSIARSVLVRRPIFPFVNDF